MADLRFVGRSDDGEHIELVDGEGNQFKVRISDSLRAAVNERRLSPVVVESPRVSIREIQARLRAGEDFAEVAQLSGLSMEKIERYASPILQERAWIIELAEKSSPKGSALPLKELIIARLSPRGINYNQISFNTWRHDDGTWQIVASYPATDGMRDAQWHFDSQKRTLVSLDDGARWINGEELPKQQPKSDRMSNHGVLFPAENDPSQPPRLVAVRTDPIERDEVPNELPVDAKKDGVTRRISIPSWDDIMFGRGKKKDNEDSEQ